MKAPLAATMLILAVAGLIGLDNHRVLAGLRSQHENLQRASRAAGWSGGTDGMNLTSPRRRDAPVIREQAIRELAETMVEFGRKIRMDDSVASRRSPEITELRYRINETLLRLSAAEAELLLDHLRELANGEVFIVFGYSFTYQVLEALADSRPADSIALAELIAMTHPDEAEDARIAANRSLSNWAKRDPMAALGWLRRHAGSDSSFITSEMKGTVIGSVARLDPGLALRLSVEFGLPVDDAVVSKIAASATTPEARAAVLDLIRGHLGTVSDLEARADLRVSALSSMLDKACRQGFEQASSWLDQAGLSDGEVEAALSGFTVPAAEDPGCWISWLSARFPEPSRNRVRQLMKNWTRSDYPAATAWLGGIPDGPFRREATAVYAETVAPYYPAEAATWAITLDEGDKRTALLRRIHSSWQKKDAAGAAEFARQHGLGE
jgi:hypothetical protein